MVYAWRQRVNRRSNRRFKRRAMPVMISKRILKASLNSGVHTFKRSYVTEIQVKNNASLSGGIGHFANSGASTTGQVTPLELSKLPNYTEFVALFDQYQLNAVKFRFIYDHNVSQINAQEGTVYNGIPSMYIVEDKDDAVPLTSVNEYLEHENVKIKRMDKPYSIYIKNPCLAMMAYESGATTGYVRKGKQWVDCSDESVDHFALKWCIDAQSGILDLSKSQIIGQLKVITTWYFKTRDVR